MQLLPNNWIWYFAFGAQQKSSLLNEFARQHKLHYIKSQKDLTKYKSTSCIIQTDVQTLLSWESQIPHIQLIFIGNQFNQDELNIKKQYRQIGKCKHYPAFNDYQNFRKLMYPNLIFFYGPNQQNCQGAAATIAFQASYTYTEKLPLSANQLISKVELTKNYTFSTLFTNPNEIKVLQSRFNLRIIHFKHNKNEFPNMETFFDHENQILKYLSNKSFFYSIDANQSAEKMMDQIGQILCPELVYISANNPTQKTYAQKYTNDQNTVALSIFSIQSINKRKNLSLAYTLKQKILLINSIIYKDLSLKRVVLVDFPYHVNEIRLFEQLNRKFTQYVELDSPEEWMFSKQYTSGMYFLQTQRFLRLDMNYELKQQMNKTKKYWVVTGAQGAGKTTVAKYLALRYGLQLIQVQTYISQLKEKLQSPEDGDQLPIHKILSHFKQLISNSQNQELIFDSFPFDPKKWFDAIGAPHLISLRVDPNELIKRQRKKNESDVSAEISEEEVLKAQQSIKEEQKLTQFFTQISPQTVSYSIDYNCTMIQSQKLISSVYQPRVFFIQSMPTLLYHNIALRYDCAFYNLAIHSFQEIKNFVKQQDKRNVIIFGYQQVEDKMVSQDFYWIQQNIGKIRYLSIWNGQNKSFKQEFLHLQKPIVQKPQKSIQQGDQETEQQPVQEQQGELKKKVLDIYSYGWTKPICHKNLSQWYFKLKKSILEFKGNEKEIYKGFAEKINKIRENGTVNIYETVVSDQGK